MKHIEGRSHTKLRALFERAPEKERESVPLASFGAVQMAEQFVLG